MTEVQQKVLRAIRDIKELEDLHLRFVDEMEAYNKVGSDYGALESLSGRILIYSLGHKIKIARRPVTVDGAIAALEYAFATAWRDADVTVLRLYLQPQGVFTRDARGEEIFADFHGADFKHRLLIAMAEALLGSQVYAVAGD